jgi:enoyl-CoA hydratase/carnithine racemase
MSDILQERQSSYLKLTINRPEASNALSLDLFGELNEILSENREDPDLKSVVVTGQGNKCFAAGGDVKELNNVRSNEEINQMISIGRQALNTIRFYPVPVIALINGHALGGGAELALSCDYRIAVESASLGFSQSKLNITTAWGGVIDLIDLVGNSKALLILLEGNAFSAEKAKEWGMVDWVASTLEDGLKILDSKLDSLDGCSSKVIRGYKTNINQNRKKHQKKKKKIETETFIQTWSDADHWNTVEKLFSQSPS